MSSPAADGASGPGWPLPWPRCPGRSAGPGRPTPASRRRSGRPTARDDSGSPRPLDSPMTRIRKSPLAAAVANRPGSSGAFPSNDRPTGAAPSSPAGRRRPEAPDRGPTSGSSAAAPASRSQQARRGGSHRSRANAPGGGDGPASRARNRMTATTPITAIDATIASR